MFGAVAAAVVIVAALGIAANPELLERFTGALVGAKTVNSDLTPSQLPTYIVFMTAKGAKQGTIAGDTTQKAMHGKIPLVSVEHRVEVPVDTSSGMSTGKRQYAPILVTKVVDSSSPKLMAALVKNEVLVEAGLEFYGFDQYGALALKYKVTLKEAFIVGYDLGDAADKKELPLEEISLVATAYEWTWVPSGLSVHDSAIESA